MTSRQQLLQDLLHLKNPEQLDTINKSLAEYGWDWDDEPLAMLTEDMVISILQRYLSGDLNAKQVENWAWAIEDREDVSVGDEDGDNKNIFFALAELANPATEGELTPRGAKEIIAALQAG